MGDSLLSKYSNKDQQQREPLNNSLLAPWEGVTLTHKKYTGSASKDDSIFFSLCHSMAEAFYFHNATHKTEYKRIRPVAVKVCGGGGEEIKTEDRHTCTVKNKQWKKDDNDREVGMWKNSRVLPVVLCTSQIPGWVLTHVSDPLHIPRVGSFASH